MGYYQQKARHNTDAGRKDPKFVEIFDQMREMEYTVSQARMIARHACYYMELHPDWTKEQAIRKALD